jgi:hypothetical protein
MLVWDCNEMRRARTVKILKKKKAKVKAKSTQQENSGRGGGNKSVGF